MNYFTPDEITEANMSELLSCPFCGSVPRSAPTYGTAICTNVSCFLGQGPIPIKEWNTRPITPLQAAERAFIEAYREYDRTDGRPELINQRTDKMVVAWCHLQQLEGESNG